jgi:nucleotide-binding universal stress UspA family protein
LTLRNVDGRKMFHHCFADIPVIRSLEKMMVTKILVPIDGSDLSLQAAREAVALAKPLNVPIVAYYGMTPYTYTYMADYAMPDQPTITEHRQASKRYATEQLAKVKAIADRASVACNVTMSENAYVHEGILAAAKKAGADLIVIGSHGRGPLGQVFLGSVAMRIVTTSDIPVMVIRQSAKKAKAKTRAK